MEDERDLIEFETPRVLSEVFHGRVLAPPELRKCSLCPWDAPAWPASELTVIKHRHASQPNGHLMLYCHEHLASAKEVWERGDDGYGKTGQSAPNCFMTVPLGTRRCDTCGEIVEG